MAVDPARVKSLFLYASDLPDLGERVLYLDRQCGADAELRARVEALLSADAESENNRGRPDIRLEPTQISGAGPQTDQERERGSDPADTQDFPLPLLIAKAKYRPFAVAGAAIAGRYTLVERIGEGGMGEVWVCDQTAPVKRKVALKLIKTGMDSKAVVQRFEQERQALALMEHPNIARVLDGGLTPNGQPFFVMELVNGLPLNKFCDKMKLTLKQRLKLFVPICQAVQHAHQKGIVHRDLKPPNILVTMIDARPVPKIIDFGVAKATAGKLTEETMSTGIGAVIGTLEYMSPEQAGLSGEDIDTRSDIYSLGVILYELLTGLRPIDSKRLRKVALGEMIRIIQEEEPSKPSTRLSTDAALPSQAALRQTEPKKLMAILRGDLDWVVMKCLEKQRDRRYETASGLARDIQRYLNDEVVEARPPGTAYRIKKFVHRHKGQVIAAGFVLLALTAGVIGTTIGLIRAEQQRRLAVAAQLAEGERADGERRARADADTARSQAEDQERLANRRYYNGQIALTANAVQSGQPTRALDFLETLRPTVGVEDLRGFEWYFLWNLIHRDRVHILVGHHGGSARVSVTPDGKTIATGDADGVVRLWDAETGRLIRFWQTGTSQIFCHAFSDNGKLLACGSTDRRVTIWEITSGARVGHLVLEAACGALIWLPKRDVIAAGCENGTIHLLDRNGVRLESFKALETLFINRLFVDINGNSLLSVQRGYIQGGTLAFDLATIPPRQVHQLRAGFGASLSPQGRTLAVAYYSDVQLSDVSSGSGVGRLQGHNGMIAALAFSPDGTRLLSGGFHDRSVILWDVARQEQIGRWPSRYGMTDIQFVSGGTGWAVSGMGEAVELWKPGENRVTDRPEGRFEGRVLIAPDGGTLLIGGEGPLRRWDLATGTFVEPLPPMGSLMGLSRDGSRALTTTPPAHALGFSGGLELVAFDELSVWDIPSRNLRFKLRMAGKGRGHAILAPDGTWAAAGNDVTDVICWDLSSKELGAPVKVGGMVGCLGASSDSTTLAVGDDAGLVRLWSVWSRTEVGRFQHGPVALSSIAFSPDDSVLATADEAGTIHLLEPKTLRHLGVFTGDVEILSMTFFPDNRTLACGRVDGTIQLVDVSTFQERMVWKAHRSKVVSLVVTPDGGTLVSGTLSEEARVWRATTDSDAIARKPDLSQSTTPSPQPAVLWPTGKPN